MLLCDINKGFPGGLDGKESACSAGDWGSVPESRSYPGEGNGYPLQYSHLENPIDRGAWRAAVHRVTKNTFAFPPKQESLHVHIFEGGNGSPLGPPFCLEAGV